MHCHADPLIKDGVKGWPLYWWLLIDQFFSFLPDLLADRKDKGLLLLAFFAAGLILLADL